MKRIAIVTDTNSGLTPQEAGAQGIYLVAMPYLMDGQQYYEHRDLTMEEFFLRQSQGAQISTSQPSPGDVMAVWDEAMEEYEKLIYIPMSSGLSSSCATAKVLAQQYDGRVLVADNRRISVPQACSALQAVQMARDGMEAEEICRRLEAEGLKASIYVCVGNLNYLKKGGRITPAVAALGTVLDIKPVLQIQGGKLDSYKKVRGMKQARRCLVDAVRDDLAGRFAGRDTQLAIAYSGAPSVGEEWLDYVQGEFPDRSVMKGVLPISISCHVGPGTLGIGLVERTYP